MSDIIFKFIKSKLFIVVLLGFFIYFIFALFNSGGIGDESKVWVLAKHEVETRLKSPNSAKFPSKSKAIISEIGGKYIIKSYVDADNSFGSSVRSRFTVILVKSATGEYVTESVNIE